jgi:hypothetical protein
MLISDHVDHLLESEQARELEGHLQGCPRCRDLFAEMLSLRNEARQLEIAPPPEDLWPAIRDRIEEKHRKPVARLTEKKPLFSFAPHPSRLFYGAGAVLAAVILVSLFYYKIPFLTNERYNPDKNQLGQFELAERQYQAAIETLDKAISDQRARLNPEMAGVFRANLEIIDGSIRACRVALREHPGNQLANVHLLMCYRKKVELLNEMSSMTMQLG